MMAVFILVVAGVCCYVDSIRKYSIKVPTTEPPVAGLTGTLGTKGGGIMPFFVFLRPNPADGNYLNLA